jgi:hypothetical protein
MRSAKKNPKNMRPAGATADARFGIAICQRTFNIMQAPCARIYRAAQNIHPHKRLARGLQATRAL